MSFDKAKHPGHLGGGKPLRAGGAPGEPLLVRARDAADAAGVSERTWWRLVDSGRAPAPVRLGRSVRWRARELFAWVEAGCPPRERWNLLRDAQGGQP